MKILNIQGSVIETYKFKTTNSGNNTFHIKTNQLTPAVYYVQILTADGLINRAFVVE